MHKLHANNTTIIIKEGSNANLRAGESKFVQNRAEKMEKQLKQNSHQQKLTAYTLDTMRENKQRRAPLI